MFTGLIEEIGTVVQLQIDSDSGNLTISCISTSNGLKPGDSISVNGVCLTATHVTAESFSATISQETLACTNLRSLTTGRTVNLERSLTLESRLGGHMVQGHVDGTGIVANVTIEGDSQRWEFDVPSDILVYVVVKGSITVNGVSLTVASLSERGFSVALIPKTIEMTTFKNLTMGDTVNLEVDIIGKYVYRFMEQARNKSAADS